MITILKAKDGTGCIILTAAARAKLPADILADAEVAGEFDPAGETIITVAGEADIHVMTKPSQPAKGKN